MTSDALKRVKTQVATVYVRAISENTVVLLIGVATAVVILVSFAFLIKYPVVFIDEPWYANAAWNWLRTGSNFDPMHVGARPSVDWGYLGNLPWLISFATLGLGLFQARLVSLILGIVLLLVTFMVGRRNYGTVSGALATLLLSLSPSFLQASHYARPDITLAVVVMTAFWMACVALEENRWWAHFLAGLILALSLDIHPNAIAFILAFVVLYLFTYRSKVLRTVGTWLCATGGLIGVLYYVVAHIISDPSFFISAYSFTVGGTHQLPLLSPVGWLASVRDEIGRYHFYENNLAFGLIGASLVFLLIRHFQADQRLLVFTGTAFVGFVLFVGNKNDAYAILLYPFFMLMVAEALINLIRTGRGFALPRVFVSVLLILFLVSSTERYIRPLMANRDYDYYAVTEQIKQVIPEGARVMGEPEWWLGLANYDYRSALSLTYYHFYSGYSLTQGLEVVHPDILIVDTRWRSLLVDEGYFPPGPGFEMFNLPRKEFEDFLAERGTKLSQFNNPWHGQFEIYKIRWD